MKIKDIGVKAIIETTSAGSIASVASSLFTPTPDGRPALIRRTKKKKNKDPSVYSEGSARPEYHNTQVKGSDATPHAKPGRTKHPFKGKLVGEADIEADRKAGIKWAGDPDWKRLHDMDDEMIKDYINHKGDVSEAVAMTRQHFEVIADLIGSFPGNPNVRMDLMTHVMDKLREINPQFKDSTFVARVRKAIADQQNAPTDDDKESDAEFKAASDRIARDAVGDDTTLTPFKYSNKKESIRPERKLSGTEKKNKEHNVKKLKSHKKNFTDQYGKDGESVMYAVATKSAKKGKKYK